MEGIPDAQRPYPLTYSTLLNQPLVKPYGAQACIMEYDRIPLEVLLSAPYPSETRYRDTDRSIDH